MSKHQATNALGSEVKYSAPYTLLVQSIPGLKTEELEAEHLKLKLSHYRPGQALGVPGG
jgi:hypothetical protein